MCFFWVVFEAIPTELTGKRLWTFDIYNRSMFISYTRNGGNYFNLIFQSCKTITEENGEEEHQGEGEEARPTEKVETVSSSTLAAGDEKITDEQPDNNGRCVIVVMDDDDDDREYYAVDDCYCQWWDVIL